MPVLENAKHEAFAQALFRGESASQAYVAAGYAKNDGNAIRLKGNDKVRSRLEELQEQSAEQAGVTVESLTRELNDAMALAVKVDNPSALVAAITAKGKLHGKFEDRVRNENVNYSVADEPMTPDEWEHEFGAEAPVGAAARPAARAH